MPFRGLCAFLVIAMLGCQHDDSGPGSADSDTGSPATPAAIRAGERAYEAQCAGCHGSSGVGTEQGPPLVHRIYEPGHHSDAAFHLAASRGVRAHHWGFGDMPPVTDVTPEEVTAIVSYVRWLQRQAGIR